MFVRRDPLTRECAALYIGQWRGFDDRWPTHDKFEAALRLRANELHLYLVGDTVNCFGRATEE